MFFAVVVAVRLSFDETVLTSNSRSICKCYQWYLRMILVDDLIHCIFHYFYYSNKQLDDDVEVVDSCSPKRSHYQLITTEEYDFEAVVFAVASADNTKKTFALYYIESSLAAAYESYRRYAAAVAVVVADYNDDRA